MRWVLNIRGHSANCPRLNPIIRLWRCRQVLVNSSCNCIFVFMIKRFWQFRLFMVLLQSSLSSMAQESPFVGFFDGSKMELVFNLYILPNHEFVAKIIYGSEDRIIMGSWLETAKNKIILREIRDHEEPFVLYAAKGKSKNRTLEFKYFDQNTVNALAFGEPFNASELTYILKPDEYNFSHEYNLEKSKDSSKVIYLSHPLSEKLHRVYAFEPVYTDCDLVLMYNSMVDKPMFNFDASLNDGILSIEDTTMGTQTLGKKQPLPENIMKQLHEIKNSNKIPDTLQRENNNEIIIYTRIYPNKTFDTDVILDAQQSYFGNEKNEGEDADATEKTETIPPPKEIK